MFFLPAIVLQQLHRTWRPDAGSSNPDLELRRFLMIFNAVCSRSSIFKQGTFLCFQIKTVIIESITFDQEQLWPKYETQNFEFWVWGLISLHFWLYKLLINYYNSSKQLEFIQHHQIDKTIWAVYRFFMEFCQIVEYSTISHETNSQRFS